MIFVPIRDSYQRQHIRRLLTDNITHDGYLYLKVSKYSFIFDLKGLLMYRYMSVYARVPKYNRVIPGRFSPS